MLLYHHRGGQWRRHALDQSDHVSPRPHSTIRQEQVDDHTGFGIGNVTQFALDRLYRFNTPLSGGRKTVFQVLRIAHAVAKGIRLLVIDLLLGHVFDEREHGAIFDRFAGVGQLGGQAFARRVDIVRRARWRQRVRQRPQHGDVERQSRTFGKQRHRTPRSHRVSYAQLVEDVGIGSRQVSDRILAEDQPFKHRLMDDAACHFFVGPQRLHVRIANRRRDDVPVYSVEIDHCATSIRLLPKRHENKTQLTWHSSPPKDGWPVCQPGRRLYRVTSLANACGTPRLCQAEERLR